MIFFRCKSIDGAATRDLTTPLRRIIFIGKAALRLRLDNQRVGLGAPDSGDKRVVGVLDGGKVSRRFATYVTDAMSRAARTSADVFAFVSADAARDRRL
jgi:hypothetical protein